MRSSLRITSVTSDSVSGRTSPPGAAGGGVPAGRTCRVSGGFELESVVFVERPPQRSGVEPQRQLGRNGSHRRLEQPRADSLPPILRIDEHHRNPAEAAVVDPDRRADDPVTVDRGKAAGRRDLEEHVPVGGALVPAAGGAQPERAFDIGVRQRAYVNI